MRGLTSELGRLPRRNPFTVTFLVVLWSVAVGTGTVHFGPQGKLLAAVGFGVRPIADGHWWSLFSSLFWVDGLGRYVEVTIVIGLLCGVAERGLGTLRTIGAFVGTYLLGEAVALIVTAGGATAGEPWLRHLADSVVVTPSAAAFGACLAASGALPAVWRRRLRLVLLLTMTMLTLYAGVLPDLVRLCAGLGGLAIGPLLVPRAERPPDTEPSPVEARLLIALLVAAAAIGPLFAIASRVPGHPPLSVWQFLVSAPHPVPAEIARVCASPFVGGDCDVFRARIRLTGIGPTILSVTPVLLLLVLAEGLRRGRRFAWWGTLAVSLTLGVLGLLLLPGDLSTADGPLSLRDYAAAVPLVQPLLIIGLLLAHRGKFAVLAPRGAYRTLATTVGLTTAITAGAYLLGATLLRDQFTPVPTTGQILADLPLRFAPPGYLGEFPITFRPVTRLAVAVYSWPGVICWFVALAAVLLTFVRPRVDAPATDAALARELLRRHGGTSMAHMTTWRGNIYWFPEHGQTVVAYRVIGSVAITTGEPVGPPELRRDTAIGFARYCASMGWTPCFYGIRGTLTAELGDGWHTVQIAEEAMLPLPDLQFRGKRFQDIRTALNKAKAQGITAHRVRYRAAPDWIRDQIQELSREWLAHKRMPEMGFTLGTVAELVDDDVWCLVAADADGKLHGVTSWLPVRRDGEIIGWTLDLMRRSRAGFPGVMEFLIASMALRCRDDGLELLSLSGAPLARRDVGAPPAALERLLDLVGSWLEPAYGFRSLLAFKAKFQPQYRPLLMAYADPMALPTIATAVTQAYLPNLTVRQAMRLFGVVFGRPVAKLPRCHAAITR